MHEEKGLALCAEFFHTCGEAMLGRDFAAQRHRIAAGLCGEGSECFGFDDAVSRDHDFGPRFFLFLTEEDNASFGYALARAYAALPQEFHGVRRLAANTVGAPRGGVLTIPAFYRRFTGCPGVPPENLAWLAVPEYALACAVSGAVFSDPLGEFSKIRAQLAKGYPEDVRRKKQPPAPSKWRRRDNITICAVFATGRRAPRAWRCMPFVRRRSPCCIC